MNGGLHPHDCVLRLKVPRKDGGRGLISVEDCVNQTRISLERYVRSTEEELLKAERELKVMKRLPVLKEGGLKKKTEWKENRYMGSLGDRMKTKRVRKHGLG